MNRKHLLSYERNSQLGNPYGKSPYGKKTKIIYWALENKALILFISLNSWHEELWMVNVQYMFMKYFDCLKKMNELWW